MLLTLMSNLDMFGEYVPPIPLTSTPSKPRGLVYLERVPERRTTNPRHQREDQEILELVKLFIQCLD